MSIFRDNILADQVALITGGGSGIGAGIAKTLAAHGAKIGLSGRTDEKLQAVAGAIQNAGGEAAAFPMDVREPDAVAAVIDAIDTKWGRLDILVNGAAGNFLSPAATLSPRGFSAVIDIDLKGTFHVSRAAYPLLRRDGGNIINISATLQYAGTAFQVHASSAKAGVDAMTRGLAVEWAGDGIRVNAVAPGPIADTPGMEKLAAVEEIREAVRKRVPLKRFGTVDEIGEAVLFLVSDAAAYITGEILVVDGGQWLNNASMAGLFEL